MGIQLREGRPLLRELAALACEQYAIGGDVLRCLRGVSVVDVAGFFRVKLDRLPIVEPNRESVVITDTLNGCKIT